MRVKGVEGRREEEIIGSERGDGRGILSKGGIEGEGILKGGGIKGRTEGVGEEEIKSPERGDGRGEI